MSLNTVLRSTVLVCCLIAAPTARADDAPATFVSGSSVSDLRCPEAVDHAPRVPHMPHAPTGDVVAPSVDELGNLVQPVHSYPPVLDRSKIGDFALRDSSGAPRPRRIAVWGDSHIAAGPFMPTVMQAIRDAGETVGTRFLPPTMGRANVRLPTLHAYCIGHGWSTALAFTATQTLSTGPALALRTASAGPDSYLWLDFRGAELRPALRQLQIVYGTTGAPAELTVSVNDGPEQAVALADSSGFATIRADALISTVRLRVSQGRINLQGFILDYEQAPQVTFDVFGLPGSTARGWAMTDPARLKDALHGDDYDAVVLEYGTNEGNAADFDPRTYAASLTQTLRNMRAAFPNVSCVLVGPPDRGIEVPRGGGGRSRSDLLKFARIHQQIAAAQAEIGAPFGCVPWDWQAFMGGPGGSYAWIHNNPILMGSDLTHLTGEGYKRTGTALATSLGWAGGDTSAFPR